jgi:hypothetical protein
MRREARLGFEGEMQTMTEHNNFYYPYASFTNAHLPLFKVEALYFDTQVILDLLGTRWATIGADRFENPGFGILRRECTKQTCGDACN